MASYRTNRIIRIVVLGLLILLVVVGVIYSIRAIFVNRPAASTNIGQTALLNTNADRSVSLTARGPIVADESFKSYSIVISPNSRSLTVYSGYLKTVTNQVTLNNNIPAYEQFVYALNGFGFMNGDASTNNDERGVCPFGKVYDFETLQNAKSIKKLWTATCTRGNSNSSYVSISSLFIKQIDGANSIISHIW